MATKTLTPCAFEVLLDTNGQPVAFGQIATADAGTTTAASTWTDSAGLVPNLNPIVCDASGRYVAYLTPGNSYRFTAYDAVGNLLWDQDNIAAVGLSATPTSDHTTCQGRLTLSTGVPVTVVDVTAAATLFFSPYGGNAIALYDGTEWLLYSFTELSLALGALAAATCYDIYAAASGSNVVLSSVAFGSSGAGTSTRVTALVMQDGVYVKDGDPTKRYLGTILTSGAGVSEDSFVKRFVWNYYNRTPRELRVTDTTDSWTYSLNAWQQANAAAANQLAFVIGVQEVGLDVMALGAMSANGNNNDVAVGVGLNATNALATGCLFAVAVATNNGGATPFGSVQATLRTFPPVGYNFAAWLERDFTATATISWFGDGGGVCQSGIHGSIQG